MQANRLGLARENFPGSEEVSGTLYLRASLVKQRRQVE
jgi:hypothetical protein